MYSLPWQGMKQDTDVILKLAYKPQSYMHCESTGGKGCDIKAHKTSGVKTLLISLTQS